MPQNARVTASGKTDYGLRENQQVSKILSHPPRDLQSFQKFVKLLQVIN